MLIGKHISKNCFLKFQDDLNVEIKTVKKKTNADFLCYAISFDKQLAKDISIFCKLISGNYVQILSKKEEFILDAEFVHFGLNTSIRKFELIIPKNSNVSLEFQIGV